ncbi:MAG: FtsX-like permease family protein, partial [Chloroflexi bacterium]|nr:FtsX-like permease family protein [Chloroflexota bacterium]
EMVDAILAVLAVMGALSLALSAFLIINTMNAIIAQQVWQIGVMKTIGATGGQVSRLYLTTALIYGGLALLLAVPLGIVVAHLVAVWLLGMFNVETVPFQIAPAAIGIQVAMGLAVPLLAALVPVLTGARTTVHQAISTHGIGTGFGRGRLDRLLARMQGSPPLLALSLRNTFRHKARLALTLVTLTLSGIMFIVVMSVGGSFDNTMRIMFKVGGDVSLELAHPQRASRLIEIAERVPGGSRVEVWSRQSATLSAGSGPRERRNGERYPVWLVGVPSGSTMFNPRIVGGRGLRDGDERAVLVNHQLAAKDGSMIGDEVTLMIDGEKSRWTVVGSYLNIDTLIDELYVPLVSLASATGTSGQGTTVMVRSLSEEIEPQQQLIKALNDAFAAQGIEVDDSWSASKQWQEAQSAFGALTYLLLTMALLTAVVGGIGLMSTISINVVERAREIGMMRAIGATSLSIVSLFVSEGVQVGVISWLLAVPLSYPSARLFSNLIGKIILQMPLDFVYSVAGMMLWLLIVVTLSMLASIWPALSASQVSVREALAYE